MSTFELNALLEAVAKGDVLALGELPHALDGKSTTEIDQFAAQLRPVLKDVDLMTLTESMIADARRLASRRRAAPDVMIMRHDPDDDHRARLAMLEAKMPPGFTAPVERKRNWKEQPGEPMMSGMIMKGLDEMASLMRMMRGVPVKNPHLGEHEGEYRVERTVIMDLQPGQQYFEVDGVQIPAGSYKAAVKKARKLKAQQR